jgi:hypothetical protein
MACRISCGARGQRHDGKILCRDCRFQTAAPKHADRIRHDRINELKLVIHDIAVHQKGGGRWAQRKPLYAPVFEFSDWTARVAFSSAVVAAMLDYAPNVFAEESTA